MQKIELITRKLSLKQILHELEENHILINHYAKEYFRHPLFYDTEQEVLSVFITSLSEIGMKDGGTLNEIRGKISELGMKPCNPSAGFLLRLAWVDQPPSSNSVLSGTHKAPDMAVTVLSDILEPDDSFPKGLYLRNVDGRLWLRGYVCDDTFRFDPADMFAVQKASS